VSRSDEAPGPTTDEVDAADEVDAVDAVGVTVAVDGVDGVDGVDRDAPLRADGLCLGYDGTDIVRRLSLSIPEGRITVIVGANACGKSTLLRGLARLLKPREGSVLLDGQEIHRLGTRAVATRLGILPQQPVAPEGITVADLVARGRHPHQRWFRQWSVEDEAAVAGALAATGTSDLAGRSIDELSGGQRQRVWIALALAQGTPLLLLDEPTTFLDLAHQVDVLDLLARLNEEEGRTVVIVLHDLNMAARYAHHLVAMRAGRIVAQGDPADVVTPALVAEVFDLACQVVADPLTGTPLVLPLPARHRRPAVRAATGAEGGAQAEGGAGAGTDAGKATDAAAATSADGTLVAR
jgi:iron complex transport system ATP-binding protein